MEELWTPWRHALHPEQPRWSSLQFFCPGRTGGDDRIFPSCMGPDRVRSAQSLPLHDGHSPMVIPPAPAPLSLSQRGGARGGGPSSAPVGVDPAPRGRGALVPLRGQSGARGRRGGDGHLHIHLVPRGSSPSWSAGSIPTETCPSARRPSQTHPPLPRPGLNLGSGSFPVATK